MSNEEVNIDYELLASYFAGELSADEKRAVDEWVSRSEKNQSLFEDCRVIFSLNFTEGSEAPSFESTEAWKKVAAKAGISAQRSESITVPFEPEGETESEQNIPWFRIAAVIVIAMAAVFYFFIQSSDSTTLTASNQVENFILPDSSQVALNLNSRITYLNDFGKSHRALSLEGEAYFDVTKGETVFTIHTEIGVVEVLGTAFGVTLNHDSMTVIVQRGRVSVRSIDDPEVKTVLERSEKAVLIANRILKSELTSTNDLYWANQTLTYRRTELETVFQELESIFNKRIEFIPSEIQDCKISAVFRGETFESILKNMALSMNFDYTISGDTVNISSNGCQE